jgi:hypothetical protein
MASIDIGKIRFNWRGVFDSTQAYEERDVVQYQGNNYIFTAPLDADVGWTVDVVDLMVQGISPITTEGELIVGDSVGNETTVALGATNTLLKSNGTTVGYSSNKILNGKLLLNSVETDYTGGQIALSNSYIWVDGLFYDYTPVSSTSKITVRCRWLVSRSADATNISHWRFYEGADNGFGTGAGGNYVENVDLRFGSTITIGAENLVHFEHTCDSWGEGVEGRIGLYARRYSGSHETRVHTTHYWDGATGTQFHKPMFIIEEWEVE